MHLHPTILMLSALGLASAAIYGSYDRRDADPFLEDDVLYDDLIARDAYAYAEADPYAHAYPEADPYAYAEAGPYADPEPLYDESETLELREAEFDALEQWLHARAAPEQYRNPSYSISHLHRREAEDQVSGPRLLPRIAKGNPPESIFPKQAQAAYDSNGHRTSSQENPNFYGDKSPAISGNQKSFSDLNQIAGAVNQGSDDSGKKGAWGGQPSARKSYGPAVGDDPPPKKGPLSM